MPRFSSKAMIQVNESIPHSRLVHTAYAVLARYFNELAQNRQP